MATALRTFGLLLLAGIVSAEARAGESESSVVPDEKVIEVLVDIARLKQRALLLELKLKALARPEVRRSTPPGPHPLCEGHCMLWPTGKGPDAIPIPPARWPGWEWAAGGGAG